MKQRTIVLGSSGMAGHILTHYLLGKNSSDVIDIGPRRKIRPETLLCDILDQGSLKSAILESRPNVIVNCMGVLVKASELRKKEAVWINAYLPHFLSELCIASGIRLIHLSTDCVFSGKSGPYREDAYRDGDAFYDRSKALGEIIDDKALTIRTSIIGPELRSDGTGLFDWVMAQHGKVNGYREAFWSGVTTLELARAIGFFIENNTDLRGLIHYSVPGGISKYQLLMKMNEVFDLELEIIGVDKPKLDKRLLSTRADIGVVPVDYSAQLKELKKWIDSHPDLYSNYLEKT